MDTLYIVMPAYNEEDSIEKVIRSWYPCLSLGDDASRLLVDISGSVDETEEILLQLQKEFPRLRILKDGEKQHGPKLIRMYHIAVRAGADYIFQTDSDGQTDPIEFPEMWDAREKYAAQLGMRRVRGDGQSRKAVEDVLCGILRVFFGVSVPDANAPFRLMEAALVEKYIRRLPVTYNLPNVMLTVFFSYYKENIRFVEISFKPRTGGVNSIDLKKISKIGLAALGDFAAFRRRMLAEK